MVVTASPKYEVHAYTCVHGKKEEIVKFISAVQRCQSTLEGAEATWKVGAGTQWKGNWDSAPHPQKLDGIEVVIYK